jgi:hypothetical protein
MYPIWLFLLFASYGPARLLIFLVAHSRTLKRRKAKKQTTNTKTPRKKGAQKKLPHKKGTKALTVFSPKKMRDDELAVIKRAIQAHLERVESPSTVAAEDVKRQIAQNAENGSAELAHTQDLNLLRDASHPLLP